MTTCTFSSGSLVSPVTRPRITSTCWADAGGARSVSRETNRATSGKRRSTSEGVEGGGLPRVRTRAGFRFDTGRDGGVAGWSGGVVPRVVVGVSFAWSRAFPTRDRLRVGTNALELTRWHERTGTNAKGRWRLRGQLRATGLRPSRGWGGAARRCRRRSVGARVGARASPRPFQRVSSNAFVPTRGCQRVVDRA